MADVTPAILDQYRKLGFELGATETDLQIGGHPAAHIAFSYPVTLPDGTSAKLNGHQYLVATPTDLWILSYSAGPGNEDALKPVFEQSAAVVSGEVDGEAQTGTRKQGNGETGRQGRV